MEKLSTSSPERFDVLRAAYPDLVFNLYAMAPGGPVTFEVITPDGKTFSWTAKDATTAILKAFPPVETPAPVEPPPPPAPKKPPSASSLFDDAEQEAKPPVNLFD